MKYNPYLSVMSRQRGMTIMGAIMLLIIIGFVAIIIMRILPIYLDYFTARSTLEGLREEPGIAKRGCADIKRAIERRFDISYVTNLKAKQIKCSKKSGKITLLLKYNDQRNIMGNLEAVGVFDETIQVYP